MTDEEVFDGEIDSHCECKVGRGIDTYDLSSVNEELARRWCGVDREEDSLRTLATFYNQRVLAAALDRAGVSPISGEVANLYELLTDADVSTGVRTQTRRRLESDGVAIQTIEDQFVSHQTIHTHLTDCLGITRRESRSDPEERRRTGRDRIRALQRRTEVVTADTLDGLRGSDVLELDEFDVFVDVTVLCSNCGTQYDIGELLDDGGCGCQPDAGSSSHGD